MSYLGGAKSIDDFAERAVVISKVINFGALEKNIKDTIGRLDTARTNSVYLKTETKDANELSQKAEIVQKAIDSKKFANPKQQAKDRLNAFLDAYPVEKTKGMATAALKRAFEGAIDGVVDPDSATKIANFEKAHTKEIAKSQIEYARTIPTKVGKDKLSIADYDDNADDTKLGHDDATIERATEVRRILIEEMPKKRLEKAIETAITHFDTEKTKLDTRADTDATKTPEQKQDDKF
ncbi:hypothetical protein C1645_837463 [Glomus cerebriforme]|uniref:Uncharacterized protein n=1 Tax=Glomus cerebriforme TaxID=658196 RepID=A0A397S563_9GLOM|nr:hypothetical protein C1645_837463 [Glomus cerebriforme]